MKMKIATASIQARERENKCAEKAHQKSKLLLPAAAGVEIFNER